jgi:hypothetical protein
VTLVDIPPLIVTEPDAVSEIAASVMPIKSEALVEEVENTTDEAPEGEETSVEIIVLLASGSNTEVNGR